MFSLNKFLLKKVQIKVITEESERLYSSLVQDYSPKYLFLSVPIFKRQNIFLDKDDKVEIFYVENNKPFYFSSVVVGNFKEDENYYLVIEKPQSVIQYDRRKFKRVNVVQKIKLIDLNSTPSIIHGEIIEISARSAKVKVKATGLLDKNYMVQFEIGSETFNILGYPTEFKDDSLEIGLNSLYLIKFTVHDNNKFEKLKKCIDRVDDA